MDFSLGLSAARIVTTLPLAFLSWRLWRFTIRPRLYPSEPKELPYWIPFIGHAFSLFMDFNGTIISGAKYFQDTKEPFTAMVAGQNIYVATAAEDVNAIWNNTRTVSGLPINEAMYDSAGLSEKSRKVMLQVDPSARYNAGNRRPLTPTQMVIELHHQQLHNGPKLEDLMANKIVPGLLEYLDFSNPAHPAVLSRSGQSTTVSLFELCVNAFVTEDTDAYFGPKLRQIAPDIISAFVDWEHTNWKFIMRLPDFLSRDMLKAKGTIVAAFEQYYALPRNERQGASHFVLALEDMLREVGLSEREMGQFTLLHYWAFVGNTHKLAFWVLAHLLHNSDLVSQIRQETLPAVISDHLDETCLLERCPQLESLTNEVLRLSVTTSLARAITEPTLLGGKTLQPGNPILLSISALHYDAQTWRPQSSTFQPDRFIANPKLSKGQGFRPWGGGPTLCPGRFFARRSVNAVVAILLSRYDIEVVSGKFPGMDSARPSPGVAPVLRGQDVKIRCTVRG